MRKRLLNRTWYSWLRFIIASLLLVVLCAGCAGTAPRNRPASTPSGPTLECRLRSEVRQWRGTPHKMGGTGRSGVDCSGFVQRLYHDLFNRSIPRTTALQVQSGRPIDREQLRPGDLVFFRPPFKVRHVGVYLGNDEFAHASTSKGVMISNLSDTYWRNCYWTARRYY